MNGEEARAIFTLTAAFVVCWFMPFPNDSGIGVAQEPSPPSNSHAPNGVARISEQAIDMLLRRDLRQATRVNSVMSGARTTGKMEFQGRLNLEVTPDEANAAFTLRLDGEATMGDGVSRRGRIAVYTASRSNVRTTKRLAFDAERMQVRPAEARCSTSLSIRGVQAPRILHRWVCRRAQRTLPDARAAASRNIAAQVERSVNSQVDAPFLQLYQRYVDEVRGPLDQSGCFPDLVRLSSSESHVQIEVRDFSPGQVEPPWRRTNVNDEHDVSVSLHESLIANLMESILGGETLTDSQFLNFVKSLRGAAPRPLWVHDRSIPWSVTLADRRPITTVLEDDLIRVSLRLKETNRGAERLSMPIAVEATYQPRITRDGPLLSRLGPVVLSAESPAGEPTEVPSEFRTFLERRFDAFLAEEIYFEGLTPPAGGAWGRLRRLELVQFTSRDRWLKMAYRVGPETLEPAEGANLSAAASSRRAGSSEVAQADDGAPQLPTLVTAAREMHVD